MLDPLLALTVALTFSLELGMMVLVMVLDVADSVVGWRYDRQRAAAEARGPLRAGSANGLPVFLTASTAP